MCLLIGGSSDLFSLVLGIIVRSLLYNLNCLEVTVFVIWCDKNLIELKTEFQDKIHVS